MILITVLSTATRTVSAADPESTDIDAVFADYDSSASPGCALGVIRDGELIYKRGYGMANLELAVALSPRSVFRTGSVGKQFTAMAIAMLAEKGAISLDDPLSKWFPEFPEWADTVTIRHLVHHTSGVRDYLTLTWLAGMGDDDYYTDQFALDLLSRQRHLNFGPGEEYLYSNSGYLLLAHIVSRATGSSLREWAADNMFGPLGMKDTHFHDNHTHVVPNRASGYAPSDEGFKVSETTLDMVGDGGVYTAIEDLLLWDRNFYDNQLGEGGSGLIRTVTTPGALESDAQMTYAFGLEIEEHRGLRRVSHGGAFVGFRAYSTRYPDQRLSVYVLCNRADANPGERAERVAEMFLSEIMGPLAEGSDPQSPASIVAVALDASERDRLVGHYWDAERGSFAEIVAEESALYLVLGAEDTYELTPLGDDHLAVVTPWTIADLTFAQTPQGKPKMTYLVRGGARPRTYERFEPRTLGDAELQSYAGTYFSDELDVEYVVAISEASLTFAIDRRGEHPLDAKLGETFHSSEYGSFTFQRDAEGEITAFTLDADRVTGLEFVRH